MAIAIPKLDTLFLSSLILAGKAGFLDAREKGINDDLLSGNAKDVWAFIGRHYAEHGNTPNKEIVRVETGFVVQRVGEDKDLSYFIEEVWKRLLQNLLKNRLRDVARELDTFRPREAFTRLEEVITEIRRSGSARGLVDNLMNYGDKVREDYEKAKNGVLGVCTPWETINQITMGFQEADLATFVARTSIGKTWLLLIMAHHSWAEGKNVLFVTTEMARPKIALRFVSLYLRIAYGKLRRGRLGEYGEPLLWEGLERLRTERPFHILGDVFNVDISTIDAAIERVRPDILFVDGLYLVKSTGKDRFERVSNVADEFKRLAHHWKIPIVVSTQFNRSVEQNARKADLTSMAMSDVVNFDSDWVFAAFQDDDLKDGHKMALLPLKTRESEGNKEIIINWDFQHMDFSEVRIEGGVEFETEPL